MTARDFLPSQRDLASLAQAAAACRGCKLFENATQTVFGEGPPDARVLLVGEQPGHEEDLAGRPFVGPAGRLLDEAMGEAGLDRRQVYVTNAVKHFKFIRRGKRRLHQKPNAAEQAACRPWLEAEIEATGAPLLVCLGATAAQAILGRDFRITHDRGRFQPSDFSPRTMATYHPAAILRMPHHADRQTLRDLLVTDLRLVAQTLAAS